MNVADDIGHVQSGLNNLWVDTNNNASPAVVALQRQNDMQNIIDQENQRLQIKKDQIKGAVVNTQRVIALSAVYLYHPIDNFSITYLSVSSQYRNILSFCSIVCSNLFDYYYSSHYNRLYRDVIERYLVEK